MNMAIMSQCQIENEPIGFSLMIDYECLQGYRGRVAIDILGDSQRARRAALAGLGGHVG